MTRECVEHLFKPFYIAELRNGDLYMVVYNEHDGWLLINHDLDVPVVELFVYNDELKRVWGDKEFPSLDIVRIYGHPQHPLRKTIEISTEIRSIVWKEGGGYVDEQNYQIW